MPNSAKRALVLVADGTEEIEFTVVVDVLRRAGVEVVAAGVDGPDPVVCSRGVGIVPDASLAEVVTQSFDLVVLPGGGDGVRRFANSRSLGELLRAREANGLAIAAICAAPAALAAHGVAAGRRLTAHDSVRDEVAAHGVWAEDAVVEDGPWTTSRGPGTAFDFAFRLVTALCGEEKARDVRAPMMFPGS
jgi:protein DJ-1